MARILALIVAVGVVAHLACATTVCIPTPNWVEVQQWTNTNDGYTAQYQFLDVSGDRFRSTDFEFFGHHGHDRTFAQDILVLAAESKVYITEGNPNDPSSLHCRVVSQTGSIKDPCLSYNATKISTDLIGDMKVDNYFTSDTHHGVPIYGRLLFTQTGIPVNFVQWNNLGHNEQLFLNFNQTLPANAWDIPTQCNQATVETMSPTELVKKYKLETKFLPH